MTDTPFSPDDFAASFGESILSALDLDSWRIGSDVEAEYRRIEREVKDAVRRESGLQEKIRTHIFPRLKTQPNAPKHAGVHTADPKSLDRVHRGLLFNGQVEAADAAFLIHDTLPLSIYQIGVSLVSYAGNQGSWSQRMFQRDFKESLEDRFDAVMKVLEDRAARADLPGGNGELIQKVILAWAERAVLLRKSNATWRMGRGELVTYDLLTGGGSRDVMIAAGNVLRELIETHQKFVYVAQESREEPFRMIGMALRPLEFAIVDTLDTRLGRWLHQLRFTDQTAVWDGETIPASEWIPRFIREVASKVVIGVFRAGAIGPPQIFYAHQDHADVAAHIAIADSVLQEPRGAPMLLDMARHVCRAVFGDNLDGLARNAYSAAGAPWRSVRSFP
jgi:hypothetical protein